MGGATTLSPARERQLLDAARRGEEGPYQQLVEAFRGELHAHCYRMLGSTHDAEDALQEALLRAWRGIGRFEGRSSLRSWLYTIATNTCLNLIDKRPKRVLPIDYAPPADAQDGIGLPVTEAVWIEPYPDQPMGVPEGLAGPDATIEQRESVELAFVAALQLLPATQRAVLVLREVLGFSAKETAEALDTTVASVNSALQRARKTIDEQLPDRSQQETLRALGDDGVRQVVERYIDAMARGDIDAVVSMMAEEAVWSMPPATVWFTGLEGIRDFLGVGPLSGDWRWKHVPTRASGQPAVGSYAWYEPEQAYRPFALDVLTLEGDKVRDITSFIIRATDSSDPEDYLRWPEQPLDEGKLRRVFLDLGLPDRLD